MTKEDMLYICQYALETIEEWTFKYPKKVHEDDLIAMEQLEHLMKYLKEQKDD